jgi:hypothetical protein
MPAPGFAAISSLAQISRGEDHETVLHVIVDTLKQVVGDH